MVGRFATYKVELDEVSTAYCAAIREHPAYQDWAGEAKNEPWIVPREEI